MGQAVRCSSASCSVARALGLISNGRQKSIKVSLKSRSIDIGKVPDGFREGVEEVSRIHREASFDDLFDVIRCVVGWSGRQNACSSMPDRIPRFDFVCSNVGNMILQDLPDIDDPVSFTSPLERVEFECIQSLPVVTPISETDLPGKRFLDIFYLLYLPNLGWTPKLRTVVQDREDKGLPCS